MTSDDVKSLERTILSIFVLAGLGGLLYFTGQNQPESHYTAVVGIAGSAIGAVVTWWFKLNGQSSQQH
jgi:hypothetical protein